MNNDSHIYIDTKANFKLNECAHYCYDRLINAGEEAFFVGGCVRDQILGIKPHDFDLATSASPNRLLSIFDCDENSIITAGIKHGTVGIARKNSYRLFETCEITTYRSDGTYQDHRHPHEVQFVNSLEEDLKRRDFTINALAYSPTSGIIDNFGGLDDIKSGIIKCIGDPKKRFSEDALRILRAARFIAQTGFDLDSETMFYALTKKHLLLEISSERITSELEKLLQGKFVKKALLETKNLLEVVIPEISSCFGFDQHTKYHSFDVWEHIANVVHHVDNNKKLRFAALCHDLGKPSTFFLDEKNQGHFYGHASQGTILTKNVMSRLNIDRKTKDEIILLVKRHNDTLKPTKKSIIKEIELLGNNDELFRDLLKLKRADSLGHASKYTSQVEIYDEIENLLDEMISQGIVFKSKDLKISGKDLIENFALTEGKQIGELLDLALQQVKEENINNNKDELLLYISKQISS